MFKNIQLNLQDKIREKDEENLGRLYTKFLSNKNIVSLFLFYKKQLTKK